jgi:hypothetical protein
MYLKEKDVSDSQLDACTALVSPGSFSSNFLLSIPFRQNCWRMKKYRKRFYVRFFFVEYVKNLCIIILR